VAINKKSHTKIFYDGKRDGGVNAGGRARTVGEVLDARPRKQRVQRRPQLAAEEGRELRRVDLRLHRAERAHARRADHLPANNQRNASANQRTAWDVTITDACRTIFFLVRSSSIGETKSHIRLRILRRQQAAFKCVSQRASGNWRW
jgi:hypothetical protein